jgi:hypothetical protein
MKNKELIIIRYSENYSEYILVDFNDIENSIEIIERVGKMDTWLEYCLPMNEAIWKELDENEINYSFLEATKIEV